MPFIDISTGFPDETPCTGCGWPRYCCLCEPDDDETHSVTEQEKPNGI